MIIVCRGAGKGRGTAAAWRHKQRVEVDGGETTRQAALDDVGIDVGAGAGIDLLAGAGGIIPEDAVFNAVFAIQNDGIIGGGGGCVFVVGYSAANELAGRDSAPCWPRTLMSDAVLRRAIAHNQRIINICLTNHTIIKCSTGNRGCITSEYAASNIKCDGGIHIGKSTPKSCTIIAEYTIANTNPKVIMPRCIKGGFCTCNCPAI